MRRARTANPGIAGGDAEDLAAALLQHAPAGGERAVGGAVQNGAHYGIPAVGSELLGATDKVASGIVDKNVDATGFVHNTRDRSFNSSRLPYVHRAGNGTTAGGTDFLGHR